MEDAKWMNEIILNHRGHTVGGASRLSMEHMPKCIVQKATFILHILFLLLFKMDNSYALPVEDHCKMLQYWMIMHMHVHMHHRLEMALENPPVFVPTSVFDFPWIKK